MIVTFKETAIAKRMEDTYLKGQLAGSLLFLLNTVDSPVSLPLDFEID